MCNSPIFLVNTSGGIREGEAAWLCCFKDQGLWPCTMTKFLPGSNLNFICGISGHIPCFHFSGIHRVMIRPRIRWEGIMLGVRIKSDDAHRSTWGSHVNCAEYWGEMVGRRESSYTQRPSLLRSQHLITHTHPHNVSTLILAGETLQLRVNKLNLKSGNLVLILWSLAAWLWLSHFPSLSLSFLTWKITPAPTSLLMTHVRWENII